MMRIVFLSAFAAVSEALMGQNRHDPFQVAVQKTERLIATLETPLEDYVTKRIDELATTDDILTAQKYLFEKSRIDQQWAERKHRYSAKAHLYVRAQEKYFDSLKELKIRKEAEAAGITDQEVKEKRRKMTAALDHHPLVNGKFIDFVDDLTKGLITWVREAEQEELHKKISEVLQQKDASVKRKKGAKSSDPYDESEALRKSMKTFFKFVSLTIATQYVAARGVVFNPKSSDERLRWEGFLDVVRWTLSVIPVVGPKSRNNGAGSFKIQKIQMRSKRRLGGTDTSVEPDSFLLKLVEKFKVDRNFDDRWDFGPGTLVAYILRSGNFWATKDAFAHEMKMSDRLVDQVQRLGNNNDKDPLQAMPKGLEEALMNEKFLHEYTSALLSAPGPKYYPAGVNAQASHELESYNAIDDYFLLFEQPRHCGHVKKGSKTEQKDCEAYVRAIAGMRSAEVDRLAHRMQRIHRFVDMVAALDAAVPVEDPNLPGHALTSKTVREIPMFQEFLKALAPEDADVRERELRHMTEELERYLSEADMPGVPTEKGKMMAADVFARELLATGFNKHDVKILLEKFKASGDGAGMELINKQIELDNKELQDRKNLYEDMLEDEIKKNGWGQDSLELKKREQEMNEDLEEFRRQREAEIQADLGYHRYAGKSTHWLGRVHEVFTFWRYQVTSPVTTKDESSVKPAMHVRPDQLVHYPEVYRVLEWRLSKGKLSDTLSMRVMMAALSWGYTKETLEYLFNNLGQNQGIDDLLQSLQDYRIINEVSLVDLQSWNRFFHHGYERMTNPGKRKKGERHGDGVVGDWKRRHERWTKNTGSPRTDLKFEASIYCAKMWGHLPKRNHNIVEDFKDLVDEARDLKVFIRPADDEHKRKESKSIALIPPKDGYLPYLVAWLKAEANPSARVETDQNEELKFAKNAGNEMAVDAYKNGWKVNQE